MKRIIICALVLIAGMSSGIQAQTSITRQDLRGVRHLGSGPAATSAADFAIGMSLDGGSTFVNTASVNDTVTISGLILPEPAHVGQRADIFVVIQVNNGGFLMLKANGALEPWNGNVDLLSPTLEDQLLTPELTVGIFSGQIGGGAANYLLYVGYLPTGGDLYYSDIPGQVTTTAAQSARDEAMAMFASSISADIVHGKCIACHVSGGAADGLSIQKFVPPSNADHLNVNFAQFENLVNTTSSAHILNKVRGLEFHIGGTVLMPGSVDYNNLAAFLSLLKNL